MKKYIAPLIAIALLLPPVLWAQRAARVSVDPVVEQAFTRTAPVLGRLVAKRSGQVAARVSGAIAEVSVELGDSVTTGQVLARIDDEPIALRRAQSQYRVAEAQARLTTARAQFKLANQEVQRLSGLTDSAAISQATYDDARQQQNIAQARVKEAEASISNNQANLELADLELRYTEIKAPFDGAIIRKLIEVGNYVQPGQAVFAMISDRELELEADVPGEYLAGLAPEQAIRATLENGSAHTASLRAILPEENPRTRTRIVRFNLTLGIDAGLVASAQSATIHIPVSAARDILTVHKDAVIQRGTNSIVYVVRDNTAQRTVIKTGQQVGQRIEVLDGLTEGDLTVVRGNERLIPGQAVQTGL